MTKSKMVRNVSVLVVLLFILTACVKASGKEVEEQVKENQDIDKGEEISFSHDFPQSVENTENAIQGGILKYGLVGAGEFEGILNRAFYSKMLDSQVMAFNTEPLLYSDADFKYNQEGLASYTYDIDEKTVSLTLREKTTWHDGKPVTLDDLVYAYEVICHPDYDGARYNEDTLGIVKGVEAYRNGEADTISGLTLSEDKMSLTLELNEFYPGVLYNGLWMYPIPRHAFVGVKVEDIPAHENSRTTPLGYGPFKVVNVVPGEAVEFERFDEYWQGKAKLEGIHLEMVEEDMAPTSMHQGIYDICSGFDNSQFLDYQHPDNFSYVAQISTRYNYLGYRLGEWNQESGKNERDKNKLMDDIELRKAIAYGMDIDSVNESLYNGLRFTANSPIIPRHTEYSNENQAVYGYNAEKANEILDEAGYLDIDGDGIRENKDGEEMKIIFANTIGGVEDVVSEHYIQNWADVGLDVELYNGRLLDRNTYYDYLMNDNPDFDIFLSGWNTGHNPNPTNYWGEYAKNNFTRYHSDNITEYLKGMVSYEAWDEEYHKELYNNFQEAYHSELPAVPVDWSYELVPVNKRVKNFTIEESAIHMRWHEVELTNEETQK